MSFWFAPPPPVTSSPQLSPVIADWAPPTSNSIVWFAVTAALGIVSLTLVAFEAYPFVVVTMPLAALASLAWVEVRRSYMAVGDGWVYVRTRLVAGGWTSFSSLESGKVTGKGGTTLLLRGPSFRGRVPVRDASMRRPADFHGELARQLLAQRIELSAQAQFVLKAWAGLVSASADDD